MRFGSFYIFCTTDTFEKNKNWQVKRLASIHSITKFFKIFFVLSFAGGIGSIWNRGNTINFRTKRLYKCMPLDAWPETCSVTKRVFTSNASRCWIEKSICIFKSKLVAREWSSWKIFPVWRKPGKKRFGAKGGKNSQMVIKCVDCVPRIT